MQGRRSLFSAFYERVQHYPDQVAILTPEQQWTYAELLYSVSIVRGYLKNLPPQSVVAIFIADPLWQAAAIFAALSERLIYLCLDPNQPKERLRNYIEDSQAILVLSEDALKVLVYEIMDSGVSIDILDPQATPQESQRDPQPDDIAVLFYTSGSTGTPKGILHTHKNILHEIHIHTNQFQITSCDRFSSLYSLAMLGSNRDFFAALLNGATLCSFPFKARGIFAFKQWITVAKISLLHAVPAIYRQLLHALSSDEILETVRIVFLAGDSVSFHDFMLYKRAFSPHSLFYTGIGTSETCSLFAHWFVPRDFQGPYLPSGYPVMGVQITIIDDEGSPVSPEEVGQIVVKTPCLAVGYHRNPIETERVFLKDENGVRSYFTGDYGKFDAFGRLCFLGRRDAQVKINGERIDLIEIENRLRMLPGMIECAVKTYRVQNQIHLVAYLYRHLPLLPHGEVRTFLSQFLSSSSIPSQFVDLDQMPLNANGKVDKVRLLLPTDYNIRPPLSTEREFVMVALWKKLFPDQDQFYSDTSFVELGGDSLCAVELSLLLQKHYGVTLTSGDFQQGITISSLVQKCLLIPSPLLNDLPEEIIRLRASSAYWGGVLPGKILPGGVGVSLGVNSKRLFIWIAPPDHSHVRAFLQEISLHFTVLVFPNAVLPQTVFLSETYLTLVQQAVLDLISDKPDYTLSIAGICLSGKIGLHLANHLKQKGVSIDHVYVLDGFGSKSALQAFRIGLFLQSVMKEPFSNILRKIKKRILKLRKPKENFSAGIDTPFYEGEGTFFFTEESRRIRLLFPKLGWKGSSYNQWKWVPLKGSHASFFEKEYSHNRPIILKEMSRFHEST